MQRKMFLGILTLLLAVSAVAQDPVWHKNFEEALAQAKEVNKPVLLNFSGSDWCIWCKRLDEEVLSKDAFKGYASESLVLAIADFPRGKPQAKAVKQQNESLMKKYGVRGFPTVLLISPEGEVIAQTGYARGGAASYVTHLKKLLTPET